MFIIPGIVIKICGITNKEDLASIARLRPDAVGFVLARSPREISLSKIKSLVALLPPGVSAFGVFVNPERALVEQAIRDGGIDIVQFHGDEPPELCECFSKRAIKALRLKKDDDLGLIKEYEPYVRGFLIDAWVEGKYGGTGKMLDVELSKRVVEMTNRPVILAGGLGPDNLSSVLEKVRPYGVDVSSGVEKGPGKKDIGRVQSFINIARSFGL